MLFHRRGGCRFFWEVQKLPYRRRLVTKGKYFKDQIVQIARFAVEIVFFHMTSHSA